MLKRHSHILSLCFACLFLTGTVFASSEYSSIPSNFTSNQQCSQYSSKWQWNSGYFTFFHNASEISGGFSVSQGNGQITISSGPAGLCSYMQENQNFSFKHSKNFFPSIKQKIQTLILNQAKNAVTGVPFNGSAGNGNVTIVCSAKKNVGFQSVSKDCTFNFG